MLKNGIYYHTNKLTVQPPLSVSISQYTFTCSFVLASRMVYTPLVLTPEFLISTQSVIAEMEMSRTLGKGTFKPLYHTVTTFGDPEEKTPFESIVGKGDNHIACGCQRSTVAAFSLKLLSNKRGIILAKMNLKLSPCISRRLTRIETVLKLY